MPRIVITTVAIGAEHSALARALEANRLSLARKLQAAYVPIVELPPPVREAHPHESGGRLCLLTKLCLPWIFDDADLVIFLDNDTVVNEARFDLDELLLHLGTQPIGMVQCSTQAERALYWPQWAPTHYAGLAADHGLTFAEGALTQPGLYVNSGFMVLRPRAAAAPFAEAFAIRSTMNDEARLNVGALQRGQIAALPGRYNLLWRYEKYRLGFLWPEGSRAMVKLNLLKNRLGHLMGEQRLLAEAYRRSAVVHLAFEHRKCLWLADHMTGGPTATRAGQGPASRAEHPMR